MKRCNAVFEGGGVRGIGHVGAVCRLEQAGYEFADTAGSSAGAMVAALLAAGYTGKELKKELESMDYMKFKGMDLPDYFGVVGKVFSLLISLGIYDTKYLEAWMEELLAKKGIKNFGDLKKRGKILKITASDLTEKRLLIFPDDLEEFGIQREEFSVAAAVRMSVSIPVFFEPVKWKERHGKTHVIVDGGLLSNYPVWLLDDGERVPEKPTFGFKFLDEKEACKCNSCQASTNIVDYLKSIISTCLDAVDHNHLIEGDFERTIRISTAVGFGEEKHKINAVDFNINRKDSQALFENGWMAAEHFLNGWNFEGWKRRFRQNN